MTVVFWDIDGTLLTTGRAGIFAWEDACREVTGESLELQTLKTDGLTDHQVALRIMEHVRLVGGRDLLTRRSLAEAVSPGDVSDQDLQRMVAVYEGRLPERLYRRKGRVLEGVRETLEHLRRQRPDVHSMLLTGNTEAGARAKLTHYGLVEFFEGGAFSQDSGPRSGIATRALEAVRGKFPEAMIEPGHVFVVGDTPHDIDCARAIGARTIAVASGVYKAEELRAHGAWRVLDQIPTPDEFEALIGSAA